MYGAYAPSDLSVCVVTRVEAGSNTSTVTLQVVGGERKGKSRI
jgi:hypothetical protein